MYRRRGVGGIRRALPALLAACLAVACDAPWRDSEHDGVRETDSPVEAGSRASDETQAGSRANDGIAAGARTGSYPSGAPPPDPLRGGAPLETRQGTPGRAVPLTRGSDLAQADGRAVPTPARPGPAGDPAAAGLASDTVGVLLARRLGGDSRNPTVERYWLYLPLSFTRREAWPLLLYLHGRSLRGEDLDRVRSYGLPWLLDRGQHVPFVVAAPQLPSGQRWVDTQRLGELVDTLLAGLPIDRERVYVTGFSMGAGGVWQVATALPEVFAAAAPVAATTPAPSASAVRALRRLPIRVYHGDRDEDASYADAVRMVDALRAAGADAALVTLHGEDHDIVNEVYADSTLYRWLLSHRRTGPEE